jgi:hypothetical protein
VRKQGNSKEFKPMKIKRCTIFIPSNGYLYGRIDDPTGKWIFDPDYNIEKIIEEKNDTIGFLRNQNADLAKAIEKIKATQ